MPIVGREAIRSGEPVEIRARDALVDSARGDSAQGLAEGLREWAERLEARELALDAAQAQLAAEAERAFRAGEAEGRSAGEAAGVGIIAEAREEAERILARAREEGEALRRRAEAEGLRTGQIRVEHETSETLRELREALEAIVADAHEQRCRLIRGAEDEVVALALEAARAMAADTLRDEEAYLRLVRAALLRMLDKDWVRIRVNDRDVERVRGLESRIRAAVSGLDGIEVVEDPRVDHGLLAETRHGTVDASLAGQMRELVHAIERSLAVEPPPDGGRDS